MAVTSVIDIAYAGTLIAEQITTSPWACVYANYPDRGGIPYSPQFDLEGHPITDTAEDPWGDPKPLPD